VEFTDEEGYGKYLDLHEIYDLFLNLKGIEVQYNLVHAFEIQFLDWASCGVKSTGIPTLMHNE
jgi:hypothetical protein